MTTTARATLPLLHRFLGIGMLVLSATFGVLRYFEIGPVLPEGRVSFVLACLLSAIGVVLATIAVLVVKPRAPDGLPANRSSSTGRRPPWACGW